MWPKWIVYIISEKAEIASERDPYPEDPYQPGHLHIQSTWRNLPWLPVDSWESLLYTWPFVGLAVSQLIGAEAQQNDVRPAIT